MSQTNNKELLNRNTIRQALRAWNYLNKLGQSPLVQLGIVQTMHKKMRRSATDYAYGLTMRTVIRNALQEIALVGEPDYGNKRWRPFIIIHDEYIEGGLDETVADELDLSIRSYQDWKAKALDQLVAILRDEEDQQIDLDLSEQTNVPFLAPTKPAIKMVGRDSILAELKTCLFDGDNPVLIALTGLPGVGKTALAVELAHDPDVLAFFRDGILWAKLGRESDPLVVLGVWGNKLGFSDKEMAEMPSVEERALTIHEAIGMRKMLLVVDDAWQLEDALAFRLGGPNCAQILTSRRPDIARDFAEEGAMLVPSLSPMAGQELMLRITPEFGPEEASTLSKSVDGLPLAIVLMGLYARKNVVGGSELLGVLTARLRSAKERLEVEFLQVPASSHPSLSASIPISLQISIALSDEVIGETARRALRALSVFSPKPDSFSREAALAVCNEPISAIYTLANYGLIEEIYPERITLHQTIADYAAVQRTDEAVFDRLVFYFVRFIKSNSDNYGILDEEFNNIIVALKVASSRGMNTELVSGVNDLYHFLEVRGLSRLAETLLRSAEQAARSQMDDFGLVVTLLNLGAAITEQGDYAEAERFYGESLAKARELNDIDTTGRALSGLGTIHGQRGEYEPAVAHYEEALTIARQLNDDNRVANLLQNLGGVAALRSEYMAARTYFQEALSLAQKLGDQEIRAIVLANLGVLESYRANYEQSEEYQKDALEAARELGHRAQIGVALLNLGFLADRRGEFRQAEEYHREALMLFKEIGERKSTCLVLQNLGELARKQGDHAGAKALWKEGLDLARELGHKLRIAFLVTSLAELFRDTGKFDRAEEQFQNGYALAQELEDSWLICATLVEWGKLHLIIMDYPRADKTFLEGLQIAEVFEFKEYRAGALFGLAQVAFAGGDDEQARLQGNESLTIFQNIQHYQVEKVEGWLSEHKLLTPLVSQNNISNHETGE